MFLNRRFFAQNEAMLIIIIKKLGCVVLQTNNTL